MVIALLVVGGIVLFRQEPSWPYDEAYQQLSLGASLEDAKRTVPASADGPTGGEANFIVWEGLVDGKHRKVTLDGPLDRGGNASHHPYMARSLLFHLDDSSLDDEGEVGHVLFKQKATGRAVVEAWWRRLEMVAVLVDPDGKITEKVYVRARPPSPRAALRNWIEEHWPF